MIYIENLQEWIRTNEAIYAADLPEKKLIVTMNGAFKLYHNGVVVWEGVQPYGAVEAYNNI